MSGNRPSVVTVDGPAGVGKSTIAWRLAERLGWAYLDSGALYRGLTLAAIEAGLEPEDEAGIVALGRELDLDLRPDGSVCLGQKDVSERVRDAGLTRQVPRVAALPEVRALVLEWQRSLAARSGRVVAEGRDLGTVVFPDASVKIFLDADPAVRAKRRLAQRAPSGDAADPAALARVRASIEERDRQDRSRPVAPLRPADDAWRLDTTRMTLDEVLTAVLSHVRSRIPTALGGESEA